MSLRAKRSNLRAQIVASSPARRGTPRNDRIGCWLFIETTKPDAFRIGLLGEAKPRIWTHKGKSNAILPALMRRAPLATLKGLSGICVVAGPGSFTSVRTGVLIANLLSRLLKKPLAGVMEDEAQDLARLSKRLSTFDFRLTSYVAPVYNAPPNITKPVLVC